MHAPRMLRRADIRFAKMSSGHRCLIRDLGLVKGGKGLRHHEVVLELSWRGIFRYAAAQIRAAKLEEELTRQSEAAEPEPYSENALETQY
jgi:hypothetical protein